MVDLTKRKIDLTEINRMAAADTAELIQLGETRYQQQIAQVADRFCADFSNNQVILLAGPSSSGKTTTSYRLQDELRDRGIRTIAVSLDDFFLSRDSAPLLPDGSPDLETPKLLDIEHMECCFERLFRTGSCAFPIFDFKIGARSEQTHDFTFDDHTAVIVEGLHALNPYVGERAPFQQALKLYISIKTEYYYEGKRVLNTRDARLIRRIIRDNFHRNTPPVQTLAMWENVVAGEDAHIRPYRRLADYWIDSLHLYEPLVFHPILRELLPDTGQGACAQTILRLKEQMRYFGEIPLTEVPKNSLLREFVVLP